MSKWLVYTRHHIIPKCNHNDFNVHNRENITPLLEQVHVALHRLFNGSTPKEQIRLLNSINSQVYSKELQKAFSEILNIDENDWYKPQFIK